MTVSGYYGNDLFVNQGTITVPSGQTLTLGGSSWTNTGTITANGATVNLRGSFTFAALGNFAATSGAVNVIGTLNNAGTTLPLSPAIGAWRLVGGTISGGTITSTGGSTLALTNSNGTLAGGITIAAGATLDASQNITGVDDYATVTGGLTLNGTADLGAANNTTDAQLYFQGSQTLAGTGTVVAGANSANDLYAQGNNGNAPATLTIASGITVQGGTVTVSGYYGNDLFVNQGTITVPSGQTLTLGGSSWTNTGTITANGATVNLRGSFTFAALGNFAATSGAVNVIGTLNNTGTTLPLAPAIGAWRLVGGTISGGTITSTGGSTLALTNSNGTLAGGITIAAGATLDASQNITGVDDYATVTGGLTLNGTADLGAANNTTDAQLYFQGSQTLAGTGTVVAGANSANHLYAQGNNGNAPATLTIASGITIQGGTLTIIGYYGNDSVVPNDSIEASTAGGTVSIGNGGITNTIQSFVSITASNGATIKIPESLQISGLSIMTVSPSSSLTVGGNLLGNTQNPVLFNPQGTVTLNGAGTAAAPELLEAMSADLGSVSTGFINNFAYGTLILGSNTYVKLVNQSANSPGSTAEAVYANSLVIPAGTTLNLNGLNLYVRDLQNSGTVTGGSITQIPNSGPLALDSPTPGDLVASGELDHWTFYDSGGDSLTVVLDPGSGAAGGPIAPQLQWAQVQLLDPSGHVLATAASTTAGTPLILSNVTLPADET